MAAMTVDRSGELAEIVLGCSWFAEVLAAVRAAELPDAWTGAGVLRDLVWGERFGPGFRPAEVRDVDVAFFDPSDVSRERDRAATERLRELGGGIPWEATNQAAVHTWYHETFHAEPVPPLTSTADGVATWPETATAVAVRLGGGDWHGGDDRPGGNDRHGGSDRLSGNDRPGGGGRLRVYAPLGLDDLLDGVWRRNPRRITVALSRARLARHSPARRWPGVRVVDP